MIKGVFFAFAAYGMFSWADACVKALGGSLPVFEIVFLTTIVSMGTFGVGMPEGERWHHIFQVNRPKLVAIRVLCGVVAGLCGTYAFTTLPLAQVYAIAFLLPSFATLLSIPILGEKVGWRRWLAILVGFAGVLLVVRPGYNELHLGHLAALVVAVAGAVSIIILRIVGRTEKRITLLGIVFTAAAVVNGVLMIPFFTVPDMREAGLLFFAGIFGGFAQIVFLLAVRNAPPVRVAPAQYSQIVWAVLLGAVFFDEIPDSLALVGIVLVVCSGLFTFFREEQLRGWSRRTILLRNRP